MTYSIYALCAEGSSEVRYVGITKDCGRRRRSHIRQARAGSDETHKSNWVRSVLAAGQEVMLSVIGVCHGTEEFAFHVEKEWISFYRSRGNDLTNSDEGGLGCLNPCPETRERMRQSRLGRKLSPKHRAKISQSLVGNQHTKGKKLSEEHKAKIRRAGHSLSDETKRRISEANRGKPKKMSEEARQRFRDNPPALGVRRTDAQKARYSAAQLRRYAYERANGHVRSLTDEQRVAVGQRTRERFLIPGEREARGPRKGNVASAPCRRRCCNRGDSLVSFTVRGHKEMARTLRGLAKRFPGQIVGAVRMEAEAVMRESKERYVPVDMGTLRSSGYVNEPERKGDEISVSMGYGGAAESYALSVHENPSKHDPPSWRGVAVQFRPAGRGPKYLERPLKAAVPGMAARIAARLDSGADTSAGSGSGNGPSGPTATGSRPSRLRDSRGRFARAGS